MKDFENYENIVNEIFGSNAISISTSELPTNKFINALNSENEFKNFYENYISKLRRLSGIYTSSSPNRPEIIDRVKEVHNYRNCDGAYSEIVALDYLQKSVFLNQEISLSYHLLAAKTFGKEQGKKNVDLDGYFPWYETFFDIKVFSDNVTIILEDIYKKIYEYFSDHKFLIRAEYSKLIPTSVVSRNKKQIEEELKEAISRNNKITYIRSSILPNVSFRLLQDQKILITEDSYYSYKYAKNYYTLAFRHIKKYVKEHPFFLIFVVCPWFNGVIGYPNSNNREFYRAFCRRVFMQYMNKTDRFKDVFPDLIFNGSNTVFEVSQYLSGILFLEDHSIGDVSIQGETKACGYMFLNPNAKNPICSQFYDYLRFLENMFIDDFKYDTY